MDRAREVGVRSPCNVDMYHFHRGMGHSLCGIGGNTIRGIGWVDQQSCCALAFSPCLYLTRAGLILAGVGEPGYVSDIPDALGGDGRAEPFSLTRESSSGPRQRKSFQNTK